MPETAIPERTAASCCGSLPSPPITSPCHVSPAVCFCFTSARFFPAGCRPCLAAPVDRCPRCCPDHPDTRAPPSRALPERKAGIGDAGGRRGEGFHDDDVHGSCLETCRAVRASG